MLPRALPTLNLRRPTGSYLVARKDFLGGLRGLSLRPRG